VTLPAASVRGSGESPTVSWRSMVALTVVVSESLLLPGTWSLWSLLA
jgi:hypothetical protein